MSDLSCSEKCMTAIRCLIMHIRGYEAKAMSLAHAGYATSMVRQ